MKTLTILACAATFALSGCDRAISNMQTLVSDDCGVSWQLIAPGDAVPARVGVCALKVTVPNYPMTGEAGFRTAFGYEYTIIDAKKFLLEARYLGRQNSDGDGKENSVGNYESAENTIIDRRIREATSGMLLSQDIVDFDQGRFEDVLLTEVNKRLGQRGVELASIAFVVTPDNQTRQAMDVASARRIYKSVGIEELGDRIIVARSGAAQQTVTVGPASKTPEGN
jgi:hypothetical protein